METVSDTPKSRMTSGMEGVYMELPKELSGGFGGVSYMPLGPEL